MSLDRRHFLGATALLAAPRVLFAQAATERRFVFIIQRGAADGLNTVIPYAEPAYASARGAASRAVAPRKWRRSRLMLISSGTRARPATAP
ncbi:MAG: hypothetical protein EOO25_16445, partial [Comamonadaceae bacterium]